MKIKELKAVRQGLILNYRGLDPAYHEILRKQGKSKEFIQKRINTSLEAKKSNDGIIEEFDRAIRAYEACHGLPPISHGGLDYRQAIINGAALIVPCEEIEF